MTNVRLIRTAAALAALEAALALIAVLRGRLFGLSAETYLIGAALWLSLTLGAFLQI